MFLTPVHHPHTCDGKHRNDRLKRDEEADKQEQVDQIHIFEARLEDQILIGCVEFWLVDQKPLVGTPCIQPLLKPIHYVEGVEDEDNRGDEGISESQHEYITGKSVLRVDFIFDKLVDQDRNEDGVDHLRYNGFNGQACLVFGLCVVLLHD